MEKSLQQFRQRRRKRDLLLLQQAEKILWEVEMMHRAYQKYSASTENNDPSQHGIAEAVRRFNQYRQEALDARYQLMRLRRRHVRGHNHYKFVMQHFPIPEALVVEEEETRTKQ